MINSIKKISGLLLAMVIAFTLCIPVSAAGTTTIYVNNAAIGVGGSTDVTIEASVNGTITVKYTASLLELTRCTAEGFTSDGNTVTFKGTKGVLTFKGTAEGTASIIVSSTATSGSSTTIAIGGDAPVTESEEEAAGTEGSENEPVVAEEEMTSTTVASGYGTLNETGGFDIDGVSYVVSERYADSEIPSGFSKKVVNIAGHTYNEITNGAITLLYLKPADNTQGSGVFYSYDEANSSVSKFAYIPGTNDFVILTTGSIYCEAFIDTVLVTPYGDYAVFTIEGSQFDYFYGINSAGVEAWYSYDTVLGTIARADDVALTKLYVEPERSDFEETTETDEEEQQGYSPIDNYVKKLARYRRIIAILAIICVLLIFVLVNIFLQHRHEDEDMENFFNDRARASKRGGSAVSAKKPAHDKSKAKAEKEADSDEDEEAEPERKVQPKKRSSDVIDFNDL